MRRRQALFPPVTTATRSSPTCAILEEAASFSVTSAVRPPVLRESTNADLLALAAPIYDVAFCAHTGLVYANDLDDRIRAFFLKPSVLGSEGRIAAHRGTVWVRFSSRLSYPVSAN